MKNSQKNRRCCQQIASSLTSRFTRFVALSTLSYFDDALLQVANVELICLRCSSLLGPTMLAMRPSSCCKGLHSSVTCLLLPSSSCRLLLPDRVVFSRLTGTATHWQHRQGLVASSNAARFMSAFPSSVQTVPYACAKSCNARFVKHGSASPSAPYSKEPVCIWNAHIDPITREIGRSLATVGVIDSRNFLIRWDYCTVLGNSYARSDLSLIYAWSPASVANGCRVEQAKVVR